MWWCLFFWKPVRQSGEGNMLHCAWGRCAEPPEMSVAKSLHPLDKPGACVHACSEGPESNVSCKQSHSPAAYLLCLLWTAENQRLGPFCFAACCISPQQAFVHAWHLSGPEWNSGWQLARESGSHASLHRSWDPDVRPHIVSGFPWMAINVICRPTTSTDAHSCQSSLVHIYASQHLMPMALYTQWCDLLVSHADQAILASVKIPVLTKQVSCCNLLWHLILLLCLAYWQQLSRALRSLCLQCWNWSWAVQAAALFPASAHGGLAQHRAEVSWYDAYRHHTCLACRQAGPSREWSKQLCQCYFSGLGQARCLLPKDVYSAGNRSGVQISGGREAWEAPHRHGVGLLSHLAWLWNISLLPCLQHWL